VLGGQHIVQAINLEADKSGLGRREYTVFNAVVYSDDTPMHMRLQAAKAHQRSQLAGQLSSYAEVVDLLIHAASNEHATDPHHGNWATAGHLPACYLSDEVLARVIGQAAVQADTHKKTADAEGVKEKDATQTVCPCVYIPSSK
jgi:hypothetical protein